MSVDSFPRQYARTRRFSLGEPRTISVSPTGSRVVFLRSISGADPLTSLWTYSLADGTERMLVDAGALLTGDLPTDTPEERARRERLRESAAGIVSYACDADVTLAAFTLSGALWAVNLITGAHWRVSDGSFFDPRPSPDGAWIAAVEDDSLVVLRTDGSSRRTLAAEVGVRWGVAEFVAAEEMGRHRGFWWSPDSAHLLVTRVDDSPVETAWIADPMRPTDHPVAHRYPFAGTPNADVRLFVVDLRGDRREVHRDREASPYLASVSWSEGGALAAVQSRDQRRISYLGVQDDGETTPIVDETDDDFVELVPGTPILDPSGTLVRCGERDGARALVVGESVVTPPNLQVRAVYAVDDGRVVFGANDRERPEELHVFEWRRGAITRLTQPAGVHVAVVGGPTVVVRSADSEHARASVAVLGGAELRSLVEEPLVRPRVEFARFGMRRIPVAVLTPSGHDGSPLPVLLDPYGGPHAQRVVRSSVAHATSQWFADQGFLVVVADGRGTPGLGSAWERAVKGDLAGGVLDDQIAVLDELGRTHPHADLDRVAIRGWSFGGYLAALAVLRAPDRFHAAIAGAPVTDWSLYDTHYTERYLGDPNDDPDAYKRSSLLPLAANLRRPLLLIHGLADDNVLAAHSLRLSAALTAAGRAHDFLPLLGVTHMTPQEDVAEHLLRVQLSFLRRAL